MTGGPKSRTNNKPSIKYQYNPHGGAFFDPVDVNPEDYAPGSRDNTKQSKPKSSDILTTSALISGVGRLWDFTTSSLSVLQHKTTSKPNDENLDKEHTFYYPAEEGNIVASVSSVGQNLSVNVRNSSHVSPSVQKDLNPLHVAEKLSSFDRYHKNHMCPHVWRCLRNGSVKMLKEKKIPSVVISYELQNIYGHMSNTRLTRNDVCHTDLAEKIESLSRENANNMTKTSADVTSLCSDSSGSIVPTSILQEDSDPRFLESQDGKTDQEMKFINLVKCDVEISSSTQCKLLYGLARQEHAFAGAFAGVFVSLCLHPVDTVKTVVQSCRSDQRSIPYIGKSIISERGLSGLYRGIASNIASSAPISAVYTFTYESVKGALLPLFAKEYHAVAHCMAGGCASVATSFIFTPSERIKQQMQVRSHYHSCWNALFGIVGKGGFSSLYAGWGAVLCRNVPHSIIKFYTYERLKHVISLQSNAQPTTITTLLCGGLAGSTAALFTTPFDVVKTRLQTQIPGSVNRYHGVIDTLKEIAKHEGLKGLYRGLTPRLAMYMTQGSLFFASYESFKRLFCLEARQLESNTEKSKEDT